MGLDLQKAQSQPWPQTIASTITATNTAPDQMAMRWILTVTFLRSNAQVKRQAKPVRLNALLGGEASQEAPKLAATKNR